MRKLIFFILLSTMSYAQTGSLTGNIVDKNSKSLLQGANINIEDSDIFTTSDNNGHYILKEIPVGNQKLIVSFIGYKNLELNINIESNTTKQLDFQLTQTTIPLSEVEVSITKTSKKLKDISLPISLVQEEKIKKTLSSNIADVLQNEAGISMSNDGAWGKYVTIRGMTRNNIALLVDGNRISTATNLAAGLSMFDINDIQRIETVKGGVSSLYGSGATGGAINIITKDGWYEDEFYTKSSFTTGINTVNNQNLGHLSLYTGAKKWYLKLSGMMRNAGNLQTPSGILKNSQYSDNNISFKSGFKPFDTHEIKINYQRYFGKDIGLPGGYPLFPDNAIVTYPEEKRELFSIKYTKKELFSILPKLSFKYFRQDIFRDVENIPGTVKHAGNKEIHVQKVLPNAMHETHGFQIQSDWSFSHNNHLIAGIDGWQKKMDSRREKHLKINILNDEGTTINTINQIIGERPVPLATYKTAGIYMNDEFHAIEDKFIINVGGRYDLINIISDEVLNPVYQIVNGVRNDTPANQVILWKKGDDLDFSWSGNLGLLYRPLQFMDITLTLGKSFRSPTIEERYNFIDLGSIVKIGDPELNSEESIFGDFGLRLRSSRFQFGGNIFINRLENLVMEKEDTFEGRNALKYANIGKAQLYGFDLQTSYILTDNITLSGNIAYVIGEDTYNNVPLAYISPLNGQFNIVYDFMNKLNLSLTTNIFSKQTRTADWEQDTDGYIYFDFYMHSNIINCFGIDNEFYFGIENIGNTEYRNHLATNRGDINVEPGRNFSFRWQIGI